MLSQHIARSYDADIDAMRSNLLTMGGLVERQVQRSIEALVGRQYQMVTEILVDESEVNRLHMQIDLQGNHLIARRQPLGADLREVLAGLHMTNDLERVGDEAKKIALRAGRILRGGHPLLLDPARLQVMATEVCDMLRVALDAVARQDDSVAQVLRVRDRGLDIQRRDLTEELIQAITTAPAMAPVSVELILIVQSLERVGDHAKNVAQYMEVVVRGDQRSHDDDRAEPEPGSIPTSG